MELKLSQKGLCFREHYKASVHNSVVVSHLKVLFWITALNLHRLGKTLRSISLKVAHAGEA